MREWFFLFSCIIVIQAGFEWYPLEGGNNKKHYQWGTAGDIQIWEHPTLEYVPYAQYGPSPREVSNLIAQGKKGDTTQNPRNISTWLTCWGQFIDHDMVRTKVSKVKWPISVPKCDPTFDPNCDGDKEMDFWKAEPVDEQHKKNINTCWLDASMIYGSTYEINHAIRQHRKGLLRTSNEIAPHEGEFPPFLYEIPEEERKLVEMDNAGDYPNDKLFACGDSRCNENPMLLSITTLFLREHNRVARLLCDIHPKWDDDKIFESARKYVIATIQHITIEEYSFWLLGERKFPLPDLPYNEDVDPRIHTFFSTAAFRYGHSEINDLMKRSVRGDFGNFPFFKYSKLNDHFFDPYYCLNIGISNLWEGMSAQIQQSPDTQIADAIRNHLFTSADKKSKFDLFAIDVQRNREVGIPNCNAVRKAYGLPPIKTWDDFALLAFSQDPLELKAQLARLYDTPEKAEAYICGLAENWVATPATHEKTDYSNLGALFEAAFTSQLQRLRIGDRFWYTRNLDEVNCKGDLPDVRNRTLASVIRDNSERGDYLRISDNAFGGPRVVSPKKSKTTA